MAATIHVICFGITRDLLGDSRVTLVLEEPVTVASVRRALEEKNPALGRLTSLRFAFQETYVPDDQVLPNQAEVVLIPPVSGG